jgi:hypothetical protein
MVTNFLSLTAMGWLPGSFAIRKFSEFHRLIPTCFMILKLLVYIHFPVNL